MSTDELPEEESQATVITLSLWRPWADWVILGWKTIETRTHQRFRRLGETPTLLAIHAAKSWDFRACSAASPWLTDAQLRFTERVIAAKSPGGQVLGTVMVTGFGPLTEEDEPGALIECRSVQRYGLYLKDPTQLRQRKLVRGSQGLFRVRL